MTSSGGRYRVSPTTFGITGEQRIFLLCRDRIMQNERTLSDIKQGMFCLEIKGGLICSVATRWHVFCFEYYGPHFLPSVSRRRPFLFCIEYLYPSSLGSTTEAVCKYAYNKMPVLALMCIFCIAD